MGGRLSLRGGIQKEEQTWNVEIKFYFRNVDFEPLARCPEDVKKTTQYGILESKF